MGKGNFSNDFKRDAVVQITKRGCPVAEVSRRLGVSQYSLYGWKKKFPQAGDTPVSTISLERRPGGNLC